MCKKTGRAFQVDRTAGSRAKRQENAFSRCGKALAQQKNSDILVQSTLGLHDKLLDT